MIQFGQASIETSDAGVIAAPQWIEPPDYGTGMLFLRRSRRVFCRIGKVVARREQRNGGRADDFDRMRRRTAEASG
jgi:hypothetical protein